MSAQIPSYLPDHTFTATGDTKASFKDFRGKWLVLYFYPRDATPGCTLQGQDFRDACPEFKALNAEIFGISRDNMACHERFKTKQGFNFELIDDTDEILCQWFDVMKQKNMYGKKVRGIERSTFIVNPEGQIVHAWRKVSVPGHVAEVLEQLKTLQHNQQAI